MAASEESCDGNPDFAVICSFISKFGDDCGVNVTIPCLQQMLEDTKNVHEELAELHIHLLRRGRKRVTKERWEKSLIKFCHEYSSVDAWELERFGYKKAKLSVKLEILKRLLELQFDSNPKFKTEVNKQDAHSLRIPPIGRDIDGQVYWYQLDKEYNMRLYRQGVGDESAWTLLCSTTDHLKNLLCSLEKNITNTTPQASEAATKEEKVDPAVPKQEKEGEDLTSCMSQTKPCAIIIKTEKKDLLSTYKVTSTLKTPVKADTTTDPEIDKEAPSEISSSEQETKVKECPDNQKEIKTDDIVKKEVDSSKKEDVTPLEIVDGKDKVNDHSEIAPKMDVEITNIEDVPLIDKKSKLSENTFDRKTNMNVPDIIKNSSTQEIMPEAKFKDSKIKLYEKWSNEKKQAAAAVNESTEEKKQISSTTNHQELIDSKESLPEDLTVSHKALSENSTNKSNPVKISSNEPLCDTVSRGDEVPMDLSVSCRNNDSVSKNSATDVSSNNKKRTLSDLEKTNLSYNGGSGRPSFPISDHCKTIDLKYSNTSEAPRPFKKKHLSMTKEEPVKETGDHGRKSVIFEVKNSKLFNQYQENRHSSDPIISDRTQTNSGFSHLQALQNMCNENPMTCFQSNIINSAGQDKRPPIEGSYGKYGLEKFSYNETACDNLSKKYAFSSSQLSDDMKHISDKIEPAPLLKSNLQGGSEIPPRDHPQSKSTICSSPLIAENKKSIVKDEKSGHPIKKSNHVETVPSSTFSASNVEKVEKQKVVDRCTKTLNQNAPVVAEGNRASIKEHVKVKKEKHSDNLAEPTSKGRFSKPCEDITECSKVKHTVTSMLRQDVVTSKSNDLMCSSIANKPSIVPSLSTSNESNKSFISESETDTNVTHIASSKDKLHKSDEKDNKNSNLVKNELNDNSLGHVQDNNIPPKSVKQEIPQPLPSEKLEPPIIPEVCTKPEKTLLDSSEPMDVDNKSSIVTSKSTDVPSSVIGKNSETVEQMHIPAVSNKEPVKSSSEHNQLSNSCKNSSSDTSTFSASAISKSDSIKSVKDKSEHVITNVLSTPLVKPKEEINHDNRGSNNNLKNKELLTDTKTVSIDSKTMNTDVAVPKQKIGEISENVESISDSTSLKSESTTVPYKTEKCDKENSVDTLKNELNDPNNCNTIGQQVFTSCSVKLNDSSLSLEQNQNVSIEKNVGHRNIVTSAVNNLDTREKEVCCLTTVGELNVKTEESSLLNAEPGKNSSDGSLSKTGILITTENRSLENSISDKIIETKHKSSGESELMCLDNPTKICVETGSGVNAKVNSKETSEESAKKLQSDKSKIKTLEVVVDSPVEKTICEFKKNPEKSEIDVKKDYSSIAEILDETKIAYKKKSNIEISATKVLTNRSPCETGKKSPAKLDTSTSNALLNESENKMNELVGGKELPETKITPKSETPVNIPSPELLINETEIKASGKLEAEGNSSSSIGNSQTKVTKKIAENSEAATALTSRDAVKTECDVEFNEVPSNVKKSLDKKGNKSSDNCVKISADKNSSNVPKSAKMTEIDAVHLKNKTSVKTENVKDSSQSDRLIPECQTTQAEVSEVPIKTKSETVVQSLKMKDLSQESAAKQSAKEMSKKVKSKSSTNETIVDKQDKEICVKSKDNVPCSNLEGKNDLPQESVTKHIEKDTSKNTLKTSAEEVVTSEEKCKKSYKKSKIETDTEINSLNSPFKEVAKIEIPNLQQNISPVAPVKLEAKSSEIPQNDTSDKLLVKPALSVSVADENNLKESEVSKSVMNVKKAENDSNKNDTEPAQSDNKKNDQRISNKSTRSSRTKSRSKSNCKIEIGDSTPQDLLTKSELSVESSVKNETAKCKSSKKETELTKFIKNDKHISMEDIKPEVNKDSVTTSVGEKRIKPVEVKTEVSEKKSGEEMMFDFLCNLDIKNPLNLYLVMNSRCLETKGRHPHCGQLGMKPLPSTSPSKPKLITTFSLDTNDEVQIISSTGSPTKKKRGRLRQRGPVTKSKEPSPVPEPRKTPAKLPAQKRGRNSKKPSTTSGKDNFTIPEGFLEILSNSQSETTKAEPQRKSRGQKSKVSTPSLQSSESESAPIKRSRRIQEQHQKKMSELAVEMEREQRMLEQMAKKSAKKGSTPKSTPKAQEAKNSRATKSKFQPPTPEETLLESKRSTRKMNSRSRNMTKMTLMYEDESKDSEFSTSRETEKSKKRRRGKGARKGYKPWDVSSESSSSIEELTEEEEEEHEEPLVFEVNEDEFACEEVEEDAEPIVVRRARTAKKAPEDTTAEENVVIDDKPCSKCGKYDKPEWILLCDKCDNGYHTQCLIPPLVIIPEGDWYCQPCEHAFLCDVLQKELHRLELILKQREREELRKQRLAYVGISLDNVLKPEKKEKSDESSKEDEETDEGDNKGRNAKESSDDERHKKLYGKRSVRARRNVNYQFKEYDALIASAIQEEMLGVTEDEDDIKNKVKEEENDKSFTAKIPRRGGRKRSSRLNDLDFSDEDLDSGEEYKGSSSESEQTAPPSSHGSDGESAASGEWRIVRTKGKPKRKPRRKRRGSSDEEWEEGNESDTYRPATRRAAQKAISYREISSEDDEWNPNPKPKASKKRKKEFSSEDSEASYKKKKTKRKSRVRKWASSSSSEESERSMSFSKSSEGSEDEWKVKKSSEGTKLKININKKVLSSDENDDSRESTIKKRSNKIVSEAESEEEEEEEDDENQDEDDDEEEDEEEEGSSEEEEEDEEEEEEEEVVKKVSVKKPDTVSQKVELKPVSVSIVREQVSSVKEPVKLDVPKAVETASTMKKDNVPPVEPTKEKVAVVNVKDKVPLRTVKKEATKMVPCVIPYDKSPKSGHSTTPDEENEEAVKDKAESVSSAVKQLSFTKKVPTLSTSRSHNPAARPFASTIIQPFSNIDDENDSDDEVPLERIPPTAPASLPTKSLSFTRESEYTPAKELSGFSYTTPEEKCFPPTYSSLAPFQDYSSRPSPLKPSLVETYSNNSSPSKLTPLDSYSQTSSPKGFISLDSYSDSRKKKQHFYGTPEPEAVPRPVPEGYQGEIRFPPSPTPYSQRSPSHVSRDAGTPPRFHSQYPDTYAPPRSPEYYQNQQFYPGEERIPRPAYQPNYVPPEHGPPYVPNPYVATPVMQPNGGFMIDTLLRARNPENEEDELTGVTDIVSYITQE